MISTKVFICRHHLTEIPEQSFKQFEESNMSLQRLLERKDVYAREKEENLQILANEILPNIGVKRQRDMFFQSYKQEKFQRRLTEPV